MPPSADCTGIRVSVVIPTVSRPTLERTRAAAERQSFPAAEIVVVEDRQRRGPGWARNRGIEMATGDVVAFLDDDAVPPEDWLETMVSALCRYHAAAAGGSYIETDPFLREVRALRPLPVHEQIDTGGLVGNAGNFVARRDALLRLQNQDGHIFVETWNNCGSEDWELTLRMRRYGERLVYVPRHVTHLRRVTARQYLMHQYQRGKGVGLLYRQLRKASPYIPPHSSYLWNASKAGGFLSYATSAWFKVIGPFDLHRFSRADRFLLHWCAEKAMVLGFLRALLRDPASSQRLPS